MIHNFNGVCNGKKSWLLEDSKLGSSAVQTPSDPQHLLNFGFKWKT